MCRNSKIFFFCLLKSALFRRKKNLFLTAVLRKPQSMCSLLKKGRFSYVGSKRQTQDHSSCHGKSRFGCSSLHTGQADRSYCSLSTERRQKQHLFNVHSKWQMHKIGHREKEKKDKWDQFFLQGNFFSVMEVCRNFTLLFQECLLSLSVKNMPQNTSLLIQFPRNISVWQK